VYFYGGNMERIISEEDRIRRAEEVASRRRNRIPAESINVPTNNKPSLMRKLFCQVLSSICIFGILYFLSQNNSQAMELIKPVLSEDTDFNQIYTRLDGLIKNIGNEMRNVETIDSNEVENNSVTDVQNNLANDIQLERNVTTVSSVQDVQNSEEAMGGGDESIDRETDLDVIYIKKNGSFIKPISGRITSGYGPRTPTNIVSANHAGVDIGANTGADIVASMEGKVEVVSSQGDYGNHLKITNGEISTLYAHCSKIVVNEGDSIKQGQKIAEVGSTGRATGPHLHFEIRRNNKTVDPLKIVEI
jgi:murein DD-endopeptidase MepM/ murein hydrolase activator NlpD